jgi:prepilin-type N-terminal cleavage/methylation domain-containing protein
MTGETMKASSLTRRSGLTLLEVLITIFVMGIGMLSVLTLFPLAARKIGIAIDMDRATQAAANASAISSLPVRSSLSIREAASKYFDEKLAAIPSAGSYPSDVVHYDGAGYAATRSGPFLVGTLAPEFSPPGGRLWSWPVLKRAEIVSLDEYPFDDSGNPEVGGRRSERYSSSFLFRRNRLDDQKTMETVILVYAGRPFDFGNQNEMLLALTASGAPSTPNSKDSSEIKITNTFPVALTATPDRVIHRGSWIVDLSLTPTGKPRWKKFYQVISTNPDTGILSIDRPLEDDLTSAVWVDYLVNWFDRGTAP